MPSTNGFLRHESGSGEFLRAWFRGLEEHDRGGRATLRRARSLDDIFFVPAFHRLLNGLRLHDSKASEIRVAAVAALAAKLKEDTHPDKECPRRGTLAARMAHPKMSGGRRPRVSEARFRRLLQIDDLEDLYRPMRRTLKLLNDQASLLDLARTVYWWDQPNTRRTLALEYYQRLPEDS